jgi:hypothetical protein
MSAPYTPAKGDIVTVGRGDTLWQVHGLYKSPASGETRADLDRVFDGEEHRNMTWDVVASSLRLRTSATEAARAAQERQDRERAAKEEHSLKVSRARDRVARFATNFNPGQYSADVVLDQGHGQLLLSDLNLLLGEIR